MDLTVVFFFEYFRSHKLKLEPIVQILGTVLGEAVNKAAHDKLDQFIESTTKRLKEYPEEVFNTYSSQPVSTHTYQNVSPVKTSSYIRRSPYQAKSFSKVYRTSVSQRFKKRKRA